jgi:hypothetical protein
VFRESQLDNLELEMVWEAAIEPSQRAEGTQ